MKNYRMTLAFVTSLALTGTAIGCGASSSAPEADATPETIRIDKESQSALEGVKMQLQRRAGESSFSLAEGSDWRSVAPGVWELPSGDGNTQRVAVGEDGHRWLVAQANAELDELYNQMDTEEVKPEIEQKIVAAEKVRAGAQEFLKGASDGFTSLTASCNLTLYTGPSSPVTGFAGAAGVAQISCSGGCVTFTVSSQECCSSICTPVNSVTRTVCSTPLLLGSALSGSGSGFASVSVSPANVSQSSSSFFCQ